MTITTESGQVIATAYHDHGMVAEVAGNIYYLWLDAAGEIASIACHGRWAKNDIKYLSDPWLLGKLNEAVKLIAGCEDY